MIGDWANFVFTKVLPTAFGQLLVWLNEWQTLVVGLAILVAGSIWTRSLVRSNQRLAYLATQSLKIMTEAFAESSLGPVSQPARLAGGEGRPDLDQQLDRLRRVIRGALAVIPQTNERVDPNVAALLRNIAGYSLESAAGQNSLNDPQRRALSDVEQCISRFKSARVEQMRCMDAWDLLVRLHRAARVLRDATSEEPHERAA